MKIRSNTPPVPAIALADVNDGDVFTFPRDSVLWIATDTFRGDERMCVSVGPGCALWFNCHKLVTVVECEAVIP